MPTVTVPRADLTTDEVITVLREGLGADYNVLSRMAIGRTAFQGAHEGPPDSIVIGTIGNRIVKARVTITPRAGKTRLRISPSGITFDRVLNTFGVSRKVRRVLTTSPNLSVP